ncbi:phytoene synthase [Prochlorococcus marinus str. XMU1401]|uniref:Phytoene synthase n=1 Tax=Prochlorococcus marinus str. XMU1401 TaxID=2052594 RepID=A0A8I1X0H2_PROMR|nr:phytoene synthase [Prochlorococcus marinus]MBO8222039.1 phytoene synthase [Prochlorococcus marinus str. XMU1401]MBW3060418.1 phytoene synthase [Prochlorococcus marinus str. XMU1401E]MCQ9198335.1 phytoene synthase [Prochlorococcus marinus XMU1429]PJC84550.1 phytoene synthase [Prochlorococcus marinus str. XMU1401]
MKNSISQLDQAYEICRKETQQWAKTFYLGTLLLPQEKRKAIWAIYVWCRRTDEIMDSVEASTKSQDELSDNLDEWEENTKNVFKGNIKSELDSVLLDTIEKYPQSIQPYLDMIDGQRMDLNKFRYRDFDELKLYCYRVAGTVGLMTQNVMGIDSAYTSAPWSAMPDPSEAAIALGIANQLTNILRDVGEDRHRGRIYLPQADIEKFNYSEEELLKGKINNQWKALMNFQLTRAREWFQKSEDGIKWLSSDARWPVWTSLRLYRGILDSIERLDYDVFNNRAFVKKSVKALEIPISFLISRIK